MIFHRGTGIGKPSSLLGLQTKTEITLSTSSTFLLVVNNLILQIKKIHKQVLYKKLHNVILFSKSRNSMSINWCKNVEFNATSTGDKKDHIWIQNSKCVYEIEHYKNVDLTL